MDFVLISCSAEMLTNQILGAKILSKILSLFNANKRAVHLVSIYYDFVFVSTRRRTGLGDSRERQNPVLALSEREKSASCGNLGALGQMFNHL